MFLTNRLFKMPDRRVKVLSVSPDLVFHLMFNPFTLQEITCDLTWFHITDRESNPLPHDLQIEAMCYDEMANMVRLRCWSSTWPEVGQSDSAPALQLLVSSHVLPLMPGQEVQFGKPPVAAAAKWLQVQEDIDRARQLARQQNALPPEQEPKAVPENDFPDMDCAEEPFTCEYCGKQYDLNVDNVLRADSCCARSIARQRKAQG